MVKSYRDEYNSIQVRLLRTILTRSVNNLFMVADG